MYCPVSRSNNQFSPQLTGYCMMHSGLTCKHAGKPSGRMNKSQCKHCICKNCH